MFYETWNLGFDPGQRVDTPVTFADGTALRRGHGFASPSDFFHNPSYLRIDGRPVVFLYLTRTLTGDVAGMIQGARTVLQRLGFNPFFIGDEVYWRVTPENPDPAGPILTTTPQVDRIEQFDAITSYILYYGDPEWLLGPTGDFTGYPGTTDIVADERHLMSRVQRGDGRPGAGHPRHRVGLQRPRFPPGDEPSGPAPPMAARRGPGLDARPSLPLCRHPGGLPTLPMVMVTSWNDWNEDTGIEPIGGTPTKTDDSPSGQAYTQGYTYGGEGRQALKVLRADVNLLDRRFDGRSGAASGSESGGLVLTTRPTWPLRTGPSRRRRVGVHAHHEHG